MKERQYGARYRRAEPYAGERLPRSVGRMMVFSGNANPALAAEIARRLNLSLARALVGRFSDGEVLVEIIDSVRGMDVFIVQPHLPAGEREPGGASGDARRGTPRFGRSGDRGDALLRLRPPGPAPAFGAGLHLRQGSRQHDLRSGSGSGAHHGSARRSDPGLLQHPGRQHLRLSGVAGRRVQALRAGSHGGVARRGRRGPGPGARQASGRRGPRDHRQAASARERGRGDTSSATWSTGAA